MEYRILKSTDPEMLVSYVESYLKTGWALRGDVVVVSNTHGTDPPCWFFQVVTRG